jgi:uncharacterized metal-binding protein YceD (DUF177 family)
LKDVPSPHDEFEIDFVKLKEGVHDFQYRIGKPFFEAFGNSEVLHANVAAKLQLEKQHQMMRGDLQITGTVGITCDRCLEALNMPIDTTYRIIYKVREEAGREPEGEVELVYIRPQEFTINVAQPIYESVLLDVPMIRNCDTLENKPCNRQMLEKLDELKKTGEGEADPRWDKLKDLLK